MNLQEAFHSGLFGLFVTLPVGVEQHGQLSITIADLMIGSGGWKVQNGAERGMLGKHARKEWNPACILVKLRLGLVAGKVHIIRR